MHGADCEALRHKCAFKEGKFKQANLLFPIGFQNYKSWLSWGCFFGLKGTGKEENVWEQKLLSPGGEVLWLVMAMCLKGKAWRWNWGLATAFELQSTVPPNEHISSLYPFSNIMLTGCDENRWLNYIVNNGVWLDCQQSSHTPALGKSMLIILISSTEIPLQETA